MIVLLSLERQTAEEDGLCIAINSGLLAYDNIDEVPGFMFVNI